MTVSFRSLIPILCLGLPVFGAETTDPVMGKDLSSLDRTGLDRARPITFLGYEYESTTIDETGTDISRQVVRGSYAVSMFGAAVDVPLSCRYNPGAGNTVDNGFGDVLVSGTVGHALNDKTRIAGGVDLSLDTASRDELGNQATLLTPLVALAYSMDQQTRITGGVRYTTDVTRQSDVERTRMMELRLGGIRMINEQVFGALELRQGSDFESNRLSFAVYAAAGLEFAPHHVVRMAANQPFDRYSRENNGWQITLDYAYVF